MDHFILLLWHAFLVSLFFAFLWRSTSKDRLRFFLKWFSLMVLGGILLGWLMFPFP